MGESAYEIWLGELQVQAWDGSVLLLHDRRGLDTHIAGRFGTIVERAAQDVLGPDVRVAFAGDAAGAAHGALAATGPLGAPGSAPAITPGTAPGIALEDRFNPRHTFDQFVIGDGNRLAHAAALAVAEAPGQAYNPLFLHAPPGLGKTHLLNAIANYVTAYEPGVMVRYTTVEAFTNGFIAALNGKALDRFKHLYRNVDVLLIDDVQFLASKAKTEEEFFHTFNALYDSGRQLVLTCDRLPSQLTAIEQRLRERFEAGLVAHLTPPDWSTRITILRKRAAVDGIEIHDDTVFEVIAERITDNVRSLEGALIRIVAHHSLSGQPIDAALATSVLDAIHPVAAGRAQATSSGPGNSTPGSAAQHATLTIERIQELVAGHFALTAADLTGSGRQAKVAWARQLAMYLTRELTNSPLQRVGEAFGGRNHATVLHACRRVSDRISVHIEDAGDLQQLTELLRNNPRQQ
ncbi:MAG: chromosomal replication initiator protein DnaA [Conexibacteraceae bacterium]|nr:chromosomal replication initiator protein DnaA [Conexibacteraceae bacterium]